MFTVLGGLFFLLIEDGDFTPPSLETHTPQRYCPYTTLALGDLLRALHDSNPQNVAHTLIF